jgi:hypothetical protein
LCLIIFRLFRLAGPRAGRCLCSLFPPCWTLFLSCPLDSDSCCAWRVMRLSVGSA